MDDGGVYIAARRPFKSITELVEHYKGKSHLKVRILSNVFEYAEIMYLKDLVSV